MSVDFIKFAFSAGELAPQLLGRPDLEKYDLGLKKAHNWFVDYHGGLATRPGTQFIDYIKFDTSNVILVPFKFNADIANTYVVMFGANYIRFVQDGGYVLEAGKTITNVTADLPGVVTTSAAHGYADGDWVKIGSRTFEINVLSATTFELYDPWGFGFSTLGGIALNLLTIGTASRIYTILATPYTSAMLPELHASQRLDTLRLTHPERPPYDLKRLGHTNWTLTETVFGNGKAAPGGQTGVPTTAGAYGFIWAVTAVYADGTESGINGIYPETATANFTAVAAGYQYSWLTVPGAVSFNVYRSNLCPAASVNKGAAMGYIGSSTGRLFNEINIVPDFTRTPPQDERPFDPGRIIAIDMTNAGAGYNLVTTGVTAVGAGATGTGFIGNPITFGGIILGTSIIRGGKGFVDPVALTFSGGGAGGAADATTSPLTGCFPTLSARFQQRELYAATLNDPLTIWASKPGRLNNFDSGTIVTDSDAYSFDLDTEEITPIRHMVSMRSGLLLLTNSGVWQLTGGGVNNAVTPTNALADPHSYTGVSKLPPIKVDTDLVYQESKGSIVRLLSYNDFSKVYSGIDISILSSHFFTRMNLVTSWAYAASPYSVIWAPREDGTMLGFTIVKEQNVYAWTEHACRGQFVTACSLQEDLIDRTYFTVKHKIGTRTVMYLERLTDRQFEHVEDSFQVDSGLQLGATYPVATLVASSVSGAVTFTATAGVFSVGDVGKILRMSGGKARITGYSSTTVLVGSWIRPPRKFYPETNDTVVAPASYLDWTLDTPVSSVVGLWHLEGQTVSILADGNVLPQQVVTAGAIDLGRLATRVTAGLPYKCIARTLPLTAPDTVIESRRKRIVGVAVRIFDSRGIRVGISLAKTYPMKERTTEAYGEATELLSGLEILPTQPRWENDGSIYYVVEDPLPATILGYVLDTEIGDSKGDMRGDD